MHGVHCPELTNKTHILIPPRHVCLEAWNVLGLFLDGFCLAICFHCTGKVALLQKQINSKSNGYSSSSGHSGFPKPISSRIKPICSVGACFGVMVRHKKTLSLRQSFCRSRRRELLSADSQRLQGHIILAQSPIIIVLFGFPRFAKCFHGRHDLEGVFVGSYARENHSDRLGRRFEIMLLLLLSVADRFECSAHLVCPQNIHLL